MDRPHAPYAIGTSLVAEDLSWLPEPAGELVGRLTEMLKFAHERNAAAAIKGPDDHAPSPRPRLPAASFNAESLRSWPTPTPCATTFYAPAARTTEPCW
jgi:hypothetical protein